MKILLTGGAGFIGSHLAEQLLKRGETVIILDNLNSFYDPAIKMKNIEKIRKQNDLIFFQEDILNIEAVRKIFDTHRPDTVIHLAAYAGVRPSLENPTLYCEVNVTGTARLLEISKDYEVEHFVFGSSSSVYGVSSQLPFSENDPVDQPISPYAVTKRSGELLCSVYYQNYSLPVTCLRFFTVYGPRQRPEMAIHKFTHQIQQGNEIAVYHEGKSERDYTYVDDIVHGVLASLDRPSGFRLFNLGNSRTVVLRDLISLIEKSLGKEAKIRLLPAQPGDVPITFADISRAERMLSYSPVTSIEQGIPRFVDWYLKKMEDF